MRYPNARDAWGAVWEAAGEGDVSTLSFLLDKVATLLHPPITMDPPAVAGVLADLWRLFATPEPGASVPRKIAFYAAALGQMGRAEWLAVESEVRREVERLKAEMPEEEPVREAVLLTPRS